MENKIKMITSSTIRLFKAVPIKEKKAKKVTKELLAKTVPYGFVFSPRVICNYSDKELDTLIKEVKKEVGLSAEQMNSSFHKSWKKIKESSMEQLVLEQLIHYFTTYGFEELGIYNEESVYIPSEKLEIPSLTEKFKLIIIGGYTKEELKQKVLTLLNSGIAVKDETKTDLITLCNFVKLTSKEIDQVRNKEVKIVLYENLDLIPENPVEFLRYVLYTKTRNTLLIKNDFTIKKIKESKNSVTTLFNKYKKEYGLPRLAKIFYRFKPLFLAMKGDNQMASVINKIRKLAVKYHKPMERDYLNDVTSKIKNGITIEEDRLKKELSKANTFRKIRLGYALAYRTKDVDSILYKIRSGKSYAKDFKFTKKDTARKVLNIVKDSIIEDLKKNVNGKKIYIPEYINYTLPATEKQFTGEFPSGTCITVPKNMIFGINWKDVDSNRIDLDLSLMNSDIGKIGWDCRFRDNNASVLFSGDLTAAPEPNGSSELFYVKKQSAGSYIMALNYYNYEKDIKVPFKIMIGQEQLYSLGQNHMINPNSVLSVAKSVIDRRQRILGLVVTTKDECRFYFSECDLGNSITSSNSKFMNNSRRYLFNFYRNTLSLNEFLEKAGAKIVKDKDKCDIDLSPEALEKDKIIKLLKKN